MQSADYNGELTSVVFLQKNIAVGSGTATIAGIDLRDFIGTMKVILSYSEVNNNAPSLTINFLDSADNTTFTTITDPTFAQQTGTASNTSASTALDTRLVRRYVQARHVLTGTTCTASVSIVAVGLKQVV